MSWLHRHPSEVDLTVSEVAEVRYIGSIWEQAIKDALEAILETLAKRSML